MIGAGSENRNGRTRGVRCALAGLLLVALAPGVGPRAQTGSTAPSRPQMPGLNSAEPESPFGPNKEKLEHMREDERRKRLLADTTRLLALSTELKEQVEKASKNELSLDVVRKAAEIEKLARDVKERMKS